MDIIIKKVESMDRPVITPDTTSYKGLLLSVQPNNIDNKHIIDNNKNILITIQPDI